MIREQDIIRIEAPEISAGDRLYLTQIAQGIKVTLNHLFFKPRRTVQYPEQKRVMNQSNYRGVHRLNRDPDGRVACVACFMCETACPAHCIHIVADESPWEDREKYPKLFDIDELRCIYCGMCEEACPVDAIELTAMYEVVGRTREDMIFDKEKLLEVYDQTKDVKPRENPKITGYRRTGDRSKYDALRAKLREMSQASAPVTPWRSDVAQDEEAKQREA
ncbi:MAG TPA: NADH-quinone oxidoreductase subunit I [Phycisphaerae bacterium]|nr:NADH-quinone oxidoreductase subunit I [Phycisphaerae bacterium]